MRVVQRKQQELDMARLRLREIAEAQGLNMSQMQRRSGLTMGAVRRYWYNTSDGKENGPRLALVNLDALDSLARVLRVQPNELIGPEQEQVDTAASQLLLTEDTPASGATV